MSRRKKNYQNTEEIPRQQSYKKNITPLNNTQKEYMASLRENPITIGTGSAGSGKTFLAVCQAVSEFERNSISRIILVRPAVTTEKFGFLPGDLNEKLDPYMLPLFDALYDRWSPKQVKSMIEINEIELAPLAFMRGRTLNNSFIILDEAQNTTKAQMKLFLSRLGQHVKVAITGDLDQSDLFEINGLSWAISILEKCPSVKIVNFGISDIVRSELAKQLIKYMT